jgi:hypothetical protein
MAQLMPILTALYDQATRFATASTSEIPTKPPVRTKR